MEKTMDYYISLNYMRIIIAHQNEKKFQIIYPQLPGCMGWTSDSENIEVDAQKLLRQWIECALNDNYKIPEP